MSDTAILPTPVLDDQGNHDLLAHIVIDQPGYETVRALCGKIWKPQSNPANHDLCGTCVDIAKKMGFDIPTKHLGSTS